MTTGYITHANIQFISTNILCEKYEVEDRVQRFKTFLNLSLTLRCGNLEVENIALG